MRAADLDILFVSDAGPLSPDHWMARWSAKLSTARLVETANPLDTPTAIIAAASRATRPVLLVGYSTGAIAVALAAPQAHACRGAFLVAPPGDAALTGLDGGVWPAAPRAALPWPAMLVASRTDPWADWAGSQALAADWGAELIDAGEAGRLDVESGHGPWPDGLLKLAALLKTL